MLLTSYIDKLLLTSTILENVQIAVDNLFSQNNRMNTVALFYGDNLDCDLVRTLSQSIEKYNSSLIVINYQDLQLQSLQFLGDRYLNIFIFENVSSMFTEMRSLKTKKFKYLTSYLIIVREPLHLHPFNTTNTHKHHLDVPDSQIQQIMKHLWKYRILDMVLLCWNTNYDLFGYTLNPFLRNFEIKLFEIESKSGQLLDYNRKKYYWNKTKKLNFFNVSCFMYHTPPKIIWLPTILRSPGVFYFGGRDGYVTSVVSKMFNTRFTYFTFHTDQVLQFKMTNLGNASVLKKSLFGGIMVPGDDVIPYNLKVLDSKSIGNRTTVIQTHSPDFIMMSKLLSYKPTLEYDLLYPHEFDHICVMVPNMSKHIAFSLNKIFQPLPIKLVPITLIIFIVVWKIFRDTLKLKDNDYSSVLMYTIGIYLATSADHHTKNRTERILIVSLFIFSQTTIVAVSGLLYQSIVTPEQTLNIQTLDELAKSNYTILISSDYSGNIEEWGNNLNPEIKEKLRPTDENIMLEMILKGNTTYAYILSQMRAKLIMQKKQLWVNEQNIFHLMDECLFPGLMSYEIKKGSPLKHQAERYIEYVIQHGFMQIYVRWTSMFIFGLKDSNVYMPGYFENYHKSANPLNLDDLNSLILLYTIGFLFSIGVFMVELLRIKLLYSRTLKFRPKYNLKTLRKFKMSFANKLQIDKR